MILTGKVLIAINNLEQAEPQAFTHAKIATRIRNHLLWMDASTPESAEDVQNLAARLEASYPQLKPQVDEFRAALSEANSAFARAERDRTSTRLVRPVGNVDLHFGDAGYVRAVIDSINLQ